MTTPSKHQSDYRKRKAAQGYERLEMWVPKVLKQRIKMQAELEVLRYQAKQRGEEDNGC